MKMSVYDKKLMDYGVLNNEEEYELSIKQNLSFTPNEYIQHICGK
jgi:hypothetical protein